MGSLESYLSQIQFWHWLIFGGVLIILELLLPGTILLWTGLSALIVGIALWVIPTFGWEGQMVVFAVLSLVTVIGYRMWIKRHPIATEDSTLNQRGAQYIGREVTVSETRKGGRGRAMLDDTHWLVRDPSGAELSKGTSYRVTGVDGATLLVEKEH